MPQWAYPALVAACALISLVVTPVVLRVARRYRSFDVPDPRKVHTRQIPRLGGVAIFASVSLGLLAAVLMAIQFGLIDMSLPESQLILPIYLGLCGFFFIGFFDDLHSLPALPRLLAQLAVATLVVVFSGVGGVRIGSLFGTLVLPEWVSITATVLWIVAVVNTFNWIDGLDGLSAGVAGISAVAFLILGVLRPGLPNAELTVLLCCVLVGAIIGYLRYNFFPARIFLGDGGAFSLGYLLAITSVIGFFKQAAVISFLLPVAILALPIADTGFAILRRLLKGQPVTAPDNRHIHHRMLARLSRRYREHLSSEQATEIEESFIQQRAHRDTVLWLYGFAALFAGVAVWLGVRA